MRYWIKIYKMQDNPLLVGPKKENCECQDRPIIFFFGGGEGEGERGGKGGRLRESIIHKFGFEE